jgi:CheY-like chemotaxis protein
MEAQGIVVIEAHDEARALDLASGLLPDFIVLDSSLLEAAVDTLLESLQRNTETRQIPLVSLVNGSGPGSMLSETANAVLHKPLDADKITAFIKTLSL